MELTNLNRDRLNRRVAREERPKTLAEDANNLKKYVIDAVGEIYQKHGVQLHVTTQWVEENISGYYSVDVEITGEIKI